MTASTAALGHAAAFAHEGTRHRPDIDGLRAIAVLAVLLFHAWPTSLPGGFVGVDVFFVISGYVITRTLVRDVEAGRFSVVSFYGRRARRLFPALALAIVLALSLSWFVLLPDELVAAAKLGLSSVGSAANLHLLAEDGYFNAASVTKPLLHLWSLGVEEQFYVLWPLCLPAILAHTSRRATVIGAGAASFIAAVAMADAHPAPVFYLPLTRAWELMAGAWLALPAAKRPPFGPKAAALGAALIGAGCVWSPAGPYGAALPVAGTVLLIGSGATPVAGVLAHPVLRWLGRISYPLYLYHWPFLALRNVLVGDSGAPAYTLATLALSMLLADLTHRFIERPVQGATSRRLATGASIAALGLAALVCSAVVLGDGMPRRDVVAGVGDVSTAVVGAGAELAEQRCEGYEEVQKDARFCASDAAGPATAIVWGDSKAAALYWGLLREGRRTGEQRWALMSTHTCMPSVAPEGRAGCNAANLQAMKVLSASAAQTVVVSFSARALGRAPDLGESGLLGAMQTLRKQGKRLIFVLDNPTLTTHWQSPRNCPGTVEIPLLNEPMAARRTCALGYEKHVRDTAQYRALVERVAHAVGAPVIDLAPTLCDADGTCRISRGGLFLYSYGDHISDTANALVAPLILAAMAHVDER